MSSATFWNRVVLTAAPLLFLAPARAQTASNGGLPARPQQRQAVLDDQTPSSENKSLWKRGTLLGDLGGVRTQLARRGVFLRLSDVEGGIGNLSGGRRRLGVYEGLTRFGLRIETDKAFGWRGGGILGASGLGIRGRGLSAGALGDNILTASSIEAKRGLVLGQLWYQQGRAGSKFNVRVGQMLADLEFMSSDYAGLFTNSTFGWPALPSTDLPDGGPAYPFGALGVRLKAAPSKSWTLLGAVFNGGSANPNRPLSDASGTAFREELVFLAGGIGITPFLGMLRFLRDTRSPKNVSLLYSNSKPEDIAFQEELCEMQAGGAPNLQVSFFLSHPGEDWRGEHGRIDKTALGRLCPQVAGKGFYICGPPAFISSLADVLCGMDVPEKRIHFESFGS